MDKDQGLYNTPPAVEALIDAIHDLESTSDQSLLLCPVVLRDHVYQALITMNAELKKLKDNEKKYLDQMVLMAKPH
jgi:hypothetical protein